MEKIEWRWDCFRFQVFRFHWFRLLIFFLLKFLFVLLLELLLVLSTYSNHIASFVWFLWNAHFQYSNIIFHSLSYYCYCPPSFRNTLLSLHSLTVSKSYFRLQYFTLHGIQYHSKRFWNWMLFISFRKYDVFIIRLYHFDILVQRLIENCLIYINMHTWICNKFF